MKRFVIELLVLLSRLATAAVFGWAAWLKIQEPREFYFSIKGFQLLPEHMLQPLAFMVPWIELVCAAALVLGVWARSAGIVLGGMLLVFIAAVLSVIMRPEIHVDCGCFGDFTLLCPPGAVGWCNVGQNILLLAVALPVMLWGPGTLSWDAAARRLCRSGSCEAPKGSPEPRSTPPMDSGPAAS